MQHIAALPFQSYKENLGATTFADAVAGIAKEHGLVASAHSEQSQAVFHQYAVRLQPNKYFHTTQSF